MTRPEDLTEDQHAIVDQSDDVRDPADDSDEMNDPTKMTAKQLNTFCFVWFGLIAFAVATLGPLLAICYYRIKYEAEVNRSPWNYL